jgi:hypothetical protein
MDFVVSQLGKLAFSSTPWQCPLVLAHEHDEISGDAVWQGNQVHDFTHGKIVAPEVVNFTW